MYGSATAVVTKLKDVELFSSVLLDNEGYMHYQLVIKLNDRPDITNQIALAISKENLAKVLRGCEYGD